MLGHWLVFHMVIMELVLDRNGLVVVLPLRKCQISKLGFGLLLFRPHMDYVSSRTLPHTKQ